ncbi:TMEM175 family protein [Streptomyces sp. ICBB 8177]|uniref:TMEM175 family protein n=1 Tax=Streptomyces sp. ICBB 8177 TaxID=563922 RepID=UPI0013051907|nr:TMEM175 family protein [Streptomyces sp. ICBB 8177]
MADGDAEKQMRSVERLTIFSDAVVAIAMTLLAIELPVPSGDSAAALLTSARHQAGHYAAFLISFLAIAASWSHHYEAFQNAHAVDARLRSMNTVWLLTIVLNPFAVKLLINHGTASLDAHALRFGFYALVQAVSAALLLNITRYLEAKAPVHSQRPPRATRWQGWGMVSGFGLSVPIFFATPYAWTLWFAAPLAVAVAYHSRYGRGST